MRLFIYEYFASGMEEGPEELKKAGFAMLHAVLEDFSRIFPGQVFTLLDPSLEQEVRRTSWTGRVEIDWQEEGKNPWDRFGENLSRCDGVLLIAPETGGLLARLTAWAEDRGKAVLGSPAETIRFVSHKGNMIRFWKSRGLPVPESRLLKSPFSPGAKEDILRHFSLPLVMKPVRGTGGEGIIRVETEDQLDHLPEQISDREDYLVQEFVPGEDVSASCFVLDGQMVPLSLNRQIIDKNQDFLFRGIRLPFSCPKGEEIWDLVSRACAPVKGLTGFVGVDLVLGGKGPVLMEINARITSAYVALRQAAPGNLAWDLWRLCREGILPDKPLLKGTFTYWVEEKEGAVSWKASSG